jgi:hypothetical protein
MMDGIARSIILGIIAVILALGITIISVNMVIMSHDLTSICLHEALKGSYCG